MTNNDTTKNNKKTPPNMQAAVDCTGLPPFSTTLLLPHSIYRSQQNPITAPKPPSYTEDINFGLATSDTVTSGLCCSVKEIFTLLGCVLIVEWYLGTDVSWQFCLNCWSLCNGTDGCPQLSVTSYHYVLHINQKSEDINH
jgi:hypothetical protein